jgi:hypothetical protein
LLKIGFQGRLPSNRSDHSLQQLTSRTEQDYERQCMPNWGDEHWKYKYMPVNAIQRWISCTRMPLSRQCSQRRPSDRHLHRTPKKISSHK